MFRFLFSVFAFGCAASLWAQDEIPPVPVALVGRVEGQTYIAPSGGYRISIPVLPELGGTINDTDNVVTFQDDFNTHISIAAFKQDATQRWELASRGLKDYLIYFFSNFVLTDFKQNFPQAQIESAKFLPSAMEGSLLTYILLPGGTMFAGKVPKLGIDEKPAIAKRGNMLFVKNEQIFVISIELAERVIEGKTYKKTTSEEDEILRQRLNDVVGRMQFPRAKPVAAAK